MTRIKLEKPLTYECFQAARGILTDYSGLADTDEDGLYDFEEIDCLSTLFTVDSYGEVVEYPTFAKCLNARLGKDFYVDTGLEKYKEILKRNNQYTTLSYLDYLLDTTKVLPINSDPTREDGDGDGVVDKNDIAPLSIKQEVIYAKKLYKDASSSYEYLQNFKMNFEWFYRDNSVYNPDLALASIIYAGLAYHTSEFADISDINNNKPVSDHISKIEDEDYYAMKYGNNEMKILPEVMKLYGFKGVKTVNLRNCKDDNGQYYNDNHYIQFDIGNKNLFQYRDLGNPVDSKTNLVGIFVRGTHGTEEWYSNFNIGNTEEWKANTDWKTKANHMGFDMAATRAKKEIDKYLRDNHLNKDNTVIWLTGHSRGAAVSGIIATYLIREGYKVFAYNFATPNQVEISNKKEFSIITTGIYNVINTDDLVPYLPLATVEDFDGNISGWGFDKYGELIAYNSLNKEQREQWEEKGIYAVSDWWLDIEWGQPPQYDDSPFFLEKTLTAFREVSITRNGCYRKVDGDEYKFYIDKDMRKILDSMYAISRYYSLENDKKGEYIYQRPIVFMQILAGVAAGDSMFDSVCFISGKYNSKKYNVAAIYMGGFSWKSGMMNPHYVDGYIILCE